MKLTCIDCRYLGCFHTKLPLVCRCPYFLSVYRSLTHTWVWLGVGKITNQNKCLLAMRSASSVGVSVFVRRQNCSILQLFLIGDIRASATVVCFMP